jgi:hypothetical protein
MSLIVTVYVPEGIVLAGDSRLTLNWTDKTQNGEQHNSITSSDSYTKIFSIADKFGLGVFGEVYINEVNICGFLNQFVEQNIDADTTIDEIPERLIYFFGEKFGYPATHFYLVGYKIEDSIEVPHTYSINLANKTYRRSNFEDEQIINGVNWGGEIEVLSRILLTVKLQAGDDWTELSNNSIPWNFMTLQDAVDFGVYAVKTTIDTMRFQQKEKTVGGPIDVLVVKPHQAPIWINKKELQIYKNS